MRILLASDSYPPLIGGATLATRELARALKERGHTVSVATSWQKDAPAAEVEDGMQFDESGRPRAVFPARWSSPAIPLLPFPIRSWSCGCIACWDSFRPDVVHTYGWISASMVFALSGKKTPLVLAARDYGNVCPRRTMLYNGVKAPARVPA